MSRFSDSKVTQWTSQSADTTIRTIINGSVIRCELPAVTTRYVPPNQAHDGKLIAESGNYRYVHSKSRTPIQKVDGVPKYRDVLPDEIAEHAYVAHLLLKNMGIWDQNKTLAGGRTGEHRCSFVLSPGTIAT